MKVDPNFFFLSIFDRSLAFFLGVFSSGLLLKCLHMKSSKIEFGPSNIDVLFKALMPIHLYYLKYSLLILCGVIM